MSETLLSGLRQRVCDTVIARLPKLKECAPIEGRFNLKELKSSGIRAPAVLVSNLGAKQGETYSDEGHTFMLQMAAYVIAKNGLGVSRDIAAANICQVLLELIPGKRWGDKAFGQARDVAMVSLVTEASRDNTVSLWAVTWNQPMALATHDEAVLGFELYISEAPDIGLEHEDDYDLVGTVQV